MRILHADLSMTRYLDNEECVVTMRFETSEEGYGDDLVVAKKTLDCAVQDVRELTDKKAEIWDLHYRKHDLENKIKNLKETLRELACFYRSGQLVNLFEVATGSSIDAFPSSDEPSATSLPSE